MNVRAPLRTWGLLGVFTLVHIIVAVQGFTYPNLPMGDLGNVYEPWSHAAIAGHVVGIDESWVYPQFALVPMLLAYGISLVLGPVTGGWAYFIAWALLVTALDIAAFAALLGRGPGRVRRTAAWFWCVALLLLGPIAMYRIDAVTVPVAIVGGLWVLRRPRTAAVMLMIGAWVKVWPGALLVAAVVAARRRRLMLLLTAAAALAVIVASLWMIGADRHLFGFLAAQTERGLQVESVAATPLLWLAFAGAARIDFDHELITWQVVHPAADVLAAILTPVLAIMVTLLFVLGIRRSVGGASFGRLFPPLALALVAALIVCNKVGSPQFQTWLIAPMILWIVFDRARAPVSAVLVLVSCGLTHLVYPLTYAGLLQLELVPLLLLTARNTVVLVLLVVAAQAVIGVRSRGTGHLAVSD